MVIMIIYGYFIMICQCSMYKCRSGSTFFCLFVIILLRYVSVVCINGGHGPLFKEYSK